MYVSIQMTPTEKRHLDEVVDSSGKCRNRFLRDLIASLDPENLPVT